MLSKSFKSGKCKTSLKLAVSRIKLLKNRRDIQVKHLRQELAQLLATGQEQTARIRVEHVIREEKTMSAYDLIEIYCELIVARLPIIESQKTCPIDLKEAISSVIFASPRCADVPELVDIRKQFVAKYGKDFATSALELRPDCGVNRMIVEKLSAKTPDIETKIKIMTAIAKEHDVKWDSKPFEEELQKPKEDLLNGSSSFMRANMNSMESLKGSFSPGTALKEAVSNIIQNEIPSKPTSSNSSSHTNSEASTSPVQVARKESMTSGRKPGVSEARDSYSNEGTAASNQPTWTMEFKDAVSAAQVAAESAERASMAARAAAALAGHRNVSRQNSNDPNGSSIHGSSNVVPNRVLSSKLKDEHSESVNMNYNRDEGYQVVKEKIDKLPRDEELGRGISHHNADDTEFSFQTNNAEKFGSFRESFSRTKFVGSKNQHDEVEFVEDNVKVNYDRSTSASSITAFEDDTKDDTIWSPTGKHQTGSFQQVHDDKQHAFSDFSAPVFDDYDPEPIDRRNLLDSFDSIKEDQNFHSNAPISSAANSNIFKAPLHESSTIKTGKVPSSKFDDVKSVAYDDSDGISSDEEDMNRSFKSRTTQNSVLFHEERSSSPDSGRGEELQPSSSSKSISLRGSEEKDQLQVPSSVGTKETELASGGEFGLHFGRLAGGLRNRGYNYPPYTAIYVTDSPVSSKETASSTFSSTDRTSSRQENKFTSPIIEEESRYVQESSWNASTNPESVKEQGFRAGESIQTIRSNKNLAREKSVEDTSSFSLRQNRGDKQDPFDSTNTNVSGSEAIDQKTYDKNSHTKTLDKPIFQMSRTNFDSDGDMGERSKENSSASSNINLSRRTRDVTTKGRNNLPRSTAYSDSPTEDFESQSLHQTVQEANILPRNSNLKPGNPILSEKSEKGPTPDTFPTSSDNSTPSDSGSGMKVKGTEQRKASHVHPKLPDYETLAAHFQSLRSNRR